MALRRIDTDGTRRTPDRYDLARKEVKTDIARAIEERIPDFELSYDGMRPDWIIEKARWAFGVHRFNRPDFDELEKACPGLRIDSHIHSYDNLRSVFVVRKKKDEDGNVHIYAHIDFDGIEREFCQRRDTYVMWYKRRHENHDETEEA